MIFKMANCIEFVVQDQFGEVHTGRVVNHEKILFTKERLEEISERMIEEGFSILEMKLVMIH